MKSAGLPVHAPGRGQMSHSTRSESGPRNVVLGWKRSVCSGIRRRLGRRAFSSSSTMRALEASQRRTEAIVRSEPEGEVLLGEIPQAHRSTEMSVGKRKSLVTAAFVDRDNASSLLIYVEPGANSLAVDREVLSTMRELKKSFPQGVAYTGGTTCGRAADQWTVASKLRSRIRASVAAECSMCLAAEENNPDPATTPRTPRPPPSPGYTS